MIKISVAYATPNTQVEIPLIVEENCTVAIAIQRSGIMSLFPEIKMGQVIAGVYSQKVELDSLMNDGDRIEIYRHLLLEPNQSRLVRARAISRKPSNVNF